LRRHSPRFLVHDHGDSVDGVRRRRTFAKSPRSARRGFVTVKRRGLWVWPTRTGVGSRAPEGMNQRPQTHGREEQRRRLSGSGRWIFRSMSSRRRSRRGREPTFLGPPLLGAWPACRKSPVTTERGEPRQEVRADVNRSAAGQGRGRGRLRGRRNRIQRDHRAAPTFRARASSASLWLAVERRPRRR
jgi:hypothetical protein